MARIGAGGQGARLTAEDEKRLRKGMNRSTASEGKRERKQPDHASGRRDAAPYQHGQIAPPPPEADWSNKRKSVQGKETAKQATPKKTASEARKDDVREMLKSPGKKADTDVNVRVKGKPVSATKQASGRTSSKAAGVQAKNAKMNFGQAPKAMKKTPR